MDSNREVFRSFSTFGSLEHLHTAGSSVNSAFCIYISNFSSHCNQWAHVFPASFSGQIWVNIQKYHSHLKLTYYLVNIAWTSNLINFNFIGILKVHPSRNHVSFFWTMWFLEISNFWLLSILPMTKHLNRTLLNSCRVTHSPILE